MEVGGGLMILGCQLVREGFAVTVIEPISPGFSSFSILQKIVIDCAASRRIAPKIVALPIEELKLERGFDFAFSVNVMEHIQDVERGIDSVHAALKPGARYRFTCPNYLFPYEPHFNMPTLFSKRWTESIFHKSILASTRVEEPAPLWTSLNWITTSKIVRSCRKFKDVQLHFNCGMLSESLERMTTDPEFASRRPGWLQYIARSIVYLKLNQLTRHLPAALLPVIDCTMTRIPVDPSPAPAPPTMN